MEKQRTSFPMKKTILAFTAIISIFVTAYLTLDLTEINHKLAVNLKKNLKRSFTSYGFDTEVQGINVDIRKLSIIIDQITFKKNSANSGHRINFINLIKFDQCKLTFGLKIKKLSARMVCQEAHINHAELKTKLISNINREVVSNLTYNKKLWKILYRKQGIVSFNFYFKNFEYNQTKFNEAQMKYEFLNEYAAMLSINHQNNRYKLSLQTNPESLIIKIDGKHSNRKLYLLNANIKSLLASYL